MSAETKNAFADEQLAIATRRIKAEVPPDQKTYGLALSGGGIRSATFCLGLVRALAQKGELRKYDYLSTVSGGGYFGGMLGRLYDHQHDAKSVEKGLASDRTILLSWLRKNGRYLTPAGGKDVTLGLTQIIRSFLAALLLVTLLCVIIDTLAFYLNPLFGCNIQANSCELTHFSWAIAIPFAIACWVGVSYWLFTCRRSCLIFLTIGIVVIAIAFIVLSPLPYAFTVVISLTLLCLQLIFECLNQPTMKLSVLRLSLTKAMSLCLTVALILMLLGAIHQAGYWLYDRGTYSSHTLLAPGLVAAMKVVWEFKPVKKVISSVKARNNLVSLSLLQMANIASFVLIAFCLISVFAGLLRLTLATPSVLNNVPVFMHDGSLTFSTITRTSNAFPAFIPLALSLFAVILFLLLNRKNCLITLLNLSSLHNFYRARLERAWLSVANYRGSSPHHHAFRFSSPPLSDRQQASMDEVKVVTEPLPDDDVEMHEYQPHQYGGPLHLITCCINQTVDDRSGVYNADRKGVALTIGPQGAETGMRAPEKNSELTKSPLSKWLAISGAAAATGMGSLTKPGMAFILFLIGGRLGFWHPQLGSSRKRNAPESPFRLRYLFAEMFARFPGLSDSYWYLSDGGHFENTGVYALLKRRVDHIVVADCGADPSYVFDDLENLVRKAKIDMAIDITLQNFAGGNYASPTQVKSGKICAPLMKATINYPDSALNAGDAKMGELIIVKPHLLKGMSLATASYAARHADFPQQTTGDQFFDEEQWEAYHQLGLEAGKAIP